MNKQQTKLALFGIVLSIVVAGLHWYLTRPVLMEDYAESAVLDMSQYNGRAFLHRLHSKEIEANNLNEEKVQRLLDELLRPALEGKDLEPPQKTSNRLQQFGSARHYVRFGTSELAIGANCFQTDEGPKTTVSTIIVNALMASHVRFAGTVPKGLLSKREIMLKGMWEHRKLFAELGLKQFCDWNPEEGEMSFSPADNTFSDPLLADARRRLGIPEGATFETL